MHQTEFPNGLLYTFLEGVLTVALSGSLRQIPVPKLSDKHLSLPRDK